MAGALAGAGQDVAAHDEMIRGARSERISRSEAQHAGRDAPSS